MSRLDAHIYSPKGVSSKGSQLEVPKRPTAIVITGPTGVGKTALSIAVAKMVGGEVISADSMQVYRGMDIGTAKVRPLERDGVPHYMLDIRSVSTPFDVSDYYEEAKGAFDLIVAKNRVPIIVGGTGFYLQALMHGPPVGPPGDPRLRAEIEKELERLGIEALYEKVQMVDPLYASRITMRDKRKVVRAIEIMTLTGGLVSDLDPAKHSKGLNARFLSWFLCCPRPILYRRIEERCDEMLEEGLLAEIDRLENEGLIHNTTASQAIGYKQGLHYLHSEQSPEDYKVFVEAFKKASRRYAKKQFTWFRRHKEFRWLDVDKYTGAQAAQMIYRDFESAL